MNSVTVLGGAALGKGISDGIFENARENFDVDVIGWDNGTSDLGPNLLGGDNLYETEHNTKVDLRKLLAFRDSQDIPLLMSTALGAGSEYHVDKLEELIREVIEEEEMDSINLSKIYTDVDSGLLKQKIEEGKVRQLDYDETLTKEDVDRSEKIVGMIGPEPFIEPVENGADIVISGRGLDISPISALPIGRGFSKPLSAHMAKILECGSFAAEPGHKPQDPLIGVVKEDCFEVIPANPEYRCTVERVSSHTLYEKSDPYNIHLPDAEVDISDSKYEQVTEKRVRSTGATLREKPDYSVLIEGVRRAGFQSIVVGGVVGSAAASIDSVIRHLRNTITEDPEFPEEQYELTIRKYGGGATDLYGTEQPDSKPKPEELGVIIDVVADDQDMADDIASHARNHVMHNEHPGHNPSGNYALTRYEPIPVGETFAWNVRHLLTLETPVEICELEEEVIR